jgi:putative addiction module component (TIGR02574 family)
LLKGKGGFGIEELHVGVRSLESEVFMAQMTSQVSEILEKALTLSAQERGLLIDRLVESLDDEPAEEGIEAAWGEEIKRRVDDVRSGRAETVPIERIKERLNTRRR